MHKIHKRTKSCNFTQEVIQRVLQRDRGCIFCNRGYRPGDINAYDHTIYDVMHYINKSQGGLGIEQNGACGCRYHHNLLDNGNQGIREDMLKIFEKHLKNHYPNWDSDKLVYNKYE